MSLNEWLGKLDGEKSKLAKKRLEHAGFKIVYLGSQMLISPPKDEDYDISKRKAQEILANIISPKERVEFT